MKIIREWTTLSQHKFAEETGRSRNGINNIENNRNRIYLNDFLDICGIDIDIPFEKKVEILKKYKEDPKVINAVQAHHGDVEPQTPEAYLVQAADAISASRPGARRETLDAYIKRLEQLESIADSFEGVEKSYAIQAGREIRIIVKPERISDDEMTIMARKIAEKVENEMEYPGQIKINMIREKRVIDYAK